MAELSLQGHRLKRNKKFHKPDDLVFANAVGKPLDRHNLLHRHLRATAKKLKLPDGVDFRSFRTMHASLMRRTGARAEVARDNMGHSECPTTLEIYSKTWWEERAAAVSAVVDLVMKADDKKDEDDNSEQQEDGKARQMLFAAAGS